MALELEQPLHLVLDGRGLCRLLWIGPLHGSDPLLTHLPQAPRRQSGGWRLISCPFSRHGLSSEPRDSVVALDLAPRSWLCFAPCTASDGSRPARLLQPDPKQPWVANPGGGALRDLCQLQPPNQTADAAPSTAAADNPAERVLLSLRGPRSRPE